MSLVSVSEIRQYLSISSNEGSTSDSNLSFMANLATATVESYCGRSFEAANVVEIHDGGKPSIFINRPPINTIYEIAEYDGLQYVPLTTASSVSGERPNLSANSNTIQYVVTADTGEISRNTGYESAEQSISLITPTIFQNYSKGVRANYNGGYTTIPYDLKMVTLDLVKMVHKQTQEAGPISFQGEAKGFIPLSANFPPHIRRILDFYRII